MEYVVLNVANEVNCFGILDSFLALITQGEIAWQSRVLAIAEEEWRVLNACLVSVVHGKLSTG